MSRLRDDHVRLHGRGHCFPREVESSLIGASYVRHRAR
jgi:hypothetical protein